jgi:thioredoxin family protein/myotubularin protein
MKERPMDQDASGWKTLLTSANQLVRSATHPAAQLPVEGYLPGFDGATGWVNSPPLTAAELRGRVVLVNFWTYTCINDYRIWTAFDNHYWPACYFVDAQGQIRHHRFGEGDYEMSEMVLQQLLTEAGSGGSDQGLVSVVARGVEVAADWDSLRSPENYLGYERTDNFVSPNGSILDTSYAYAAPTRLRRNHWALAGDWTVNRQAIRLNQAEGRILYRFHARDLNLVMAPATPGGPVRFRVHLDDQPPGAAHGSDVDDQGDGTLTEPRLYQLVRQPGPVTERTFEITFLDPGVQAYAFTFG